MTINEFNYKIYNKLRAKFILDAYNKKTYEEYCSRYVSYRHMKRKKHESQRNMENFYLTARPNPGAGIGHQMANWIAGYWFAQLFELKFAHIPFSSIKAPFVANSWDSFLGFGNNEKQAKDLLENRWKSVVLPLFDEKNEMQVEQIRKIIHSYYGQKVVFVLEQDQFYFKQYDVAEDLKKKFYTVHNRDSEKLLYCNNEYNIAVHVRRGDIVQKPGENNPNLKMRWMANAYFVHALRYALAEIKTDKKIHIYLFSQGKKEDYQEFEEFPNVTYCLNMGAQESFLHMVFADTLITSKSSFSYKPALLNKGLKICPKNFWHGYPRNTQWRLLNDEGFPEEQN